MNSLNYLKSILSTLKPEEINLLEKFVLFQMSDEEALHSKSAQLIKLVLAKENYTANDIQRTLYGKINYPAFNKLVNRLKEKTLEVLLFDTSLQHGNYSIRSRAIFELRKKMMQLDLLILKGVRIKIVEELDLIIKKSNDLEIFDVLIQALYSKQRFYGIDLGKMRAMKLKVDIQFAELKWLSINASQAKFNEIISIISNSSDSKSYYKVLTETLVFLKREYDKTAIPTIRYYYNLLLVEKNQNEHKYSLASKHLSELMELIQSHKSVYSDYRIGTTALNIANNFIYEKRLGSSMDNIELAQKYFISQPLNLSVLKEIEFFNFFYQGKLNEASETLNYLISYSRTINSPLLLNKRLFFQGSVEFLFQNFKGGIELVLGTSEIDKDKEGWNIIKRIMITLFRIEMEDYESVDLKLSSLDKFIKRLLKTKSIRPRFLTIIRILRKLINENFDYTKVYQNRKKYFDLLESNDPDYCWEIKSPELVVFEKWFKAKMERKFYDHKDAMKKVFGNSI